MKIIPIIVIFSLLINITNAQDPVKKRYSLLTDLPDTSATINSLRLLMNELTVFFPGQSDKKDIFSRKDGMLVLLADGRNIMKMKKLVNKYTRTGGKIVMDIRAFAALTGYKTMEVGMNGIYVREESDITSGYNKTEPIRYSATGKLKALQINSINKNLTVLGESEKADAVLVSLKKGRGCIIAVDMLSLPEPRYSSGSENKYLFMVNAVGNRVKYGRYFPKKLNHEEFVEMMKKLERHNPSVKVINEGDASGGYSIYSLNMGNPENPGILIYSCTHGNEWENAYGTFNFVHYLAGHKEQDIIDLDRYCLKVIPVLNPAGYDKNTRQNANLVDLNRNGDHAWEKFIGEDPANYKPGSYDWKGTAPFSEPESKTLKKAAESGNYIAFLDVHGNPSGTGYNKWMGVAANTKPDAKVKGELFQKTFNDAIRGRYILHQAREKYPKLMVIEEIMDKSPSPNLYNTIAKDKYGYIVEFLCGYGNSTAFIAMQDDIITELCIAFCRTFTP